MQTESTRLMTAVHLGDLAAFDELTRQVRGRAYRVARSLVGSRDDAMELCQDALLKVFKARASYRPHEPFLPWFHRILRNTCYSFLRKHRRVTRVPLTHMSQDGEEIDYEIIDPHLGPSESAERGEHQRLIEKAITRLSARDREIIALRHTEELSYKEIAMTLGIPQGTVMSRLFHARRRLREVLGNALGGEQESGAGESGPQTP